MTTQPIVTAIMATGHEERRRGMALLTAHSFSQQTYIKSELLIINQGYQPLLVKPVPRVREVLDGRGLTVGALRNLAWQYAPGDLMICWDDDDVHHPDRIAIEVAHFSGKGVVFQNELLLHLGKGESFVASRAGGFENSLLWPRDCISRYDSDKRRGSDTHFQRSLIRELGAVTLIDNPPSLYVRLFHGRNLWDENHFLKLFRRRDPTAEEWQLLNAIIPKYREAAT